MFSDFSQVQDDENSLLISYLRWKLLECKQHEHFPKKYSCRISEISSLPTIGNSSNTEAVEVNRGQSKGATATSENSSLTSGSKGSDSSVNEQEKIRKHSEREDGQFLIQTPMKEEAAALSTLPSDVSIGKVRENLLSSKELNTTKITPEQEALSAPLNFLNNAFVTKKKRVFSLIEIEFTI